MRRMQNRIPPVVIIYKRDGERMRDRADGCRGWTGCQTEQLPFRKRWKGVGYVCLEYIYIVMKMKMLCALSKVHFLCDL